MQRTHNTRTGIVMNTEIMRDNIKKHVSKCWDKSHDHDNVVVCVSVLALLGLANRPRCTGPPPYDSWDRVQPPCKPKLDKQLRKWMGWTADCVANESANQSKQCTVEC